MCTLGNLEKGRYDPAMSITAIVQNDTIRLPEGTHFPDGTQVLIEPVKTITGSKVHALGEQLARFAGIADDLPSDLARNLDHYLHGHPKHGRP